MQHSSVDEIRARFDADVERFSNLDTGQVAAMDSPVHMDLLTTAACLVTPHATHVLDLGCGAGNYTLKLIEAFRKRGLDLPAVTLLDLSRPMLDRAAERMDAVGAGRITTVEADVREFDFGEGRFDVVLAAQCLHHLREEAEWVAVFENIFRGLRPGGSFWIADQVCHEHAAVQAEMTRRWCAYLVEVEDEAYRDQVLAYVEKEDTPRSLTWQIDLMRRVGFERIDVLLKRSRFASFGGVKPVSAGQG
jgi:tRNA (cmo5U34)-methyltransferase